ncbi:MAG: L-glutamate gamma-semialdehyde dehydrogenase [Bacteroidales bacterium]|nr:L-glutamate gamma-semialdehyde dehydrogenase [Bacteroidales bacterium]MCF8332843.1 L-glutamate gamma-semialdehyde dehydrogenase [Bacteroidales bacterium]
MNNALFTFERPSNEMPLSYAPGTKEREELKKELKRQSSQEVEIPLIIGGKEVKTGDTGKFVMPHDHQHVLATYHKAGEKEIKMAIDAALEAKKEWEKTPWVERASIAMKIAELISTKYRYLINASTMLGQSKTPHQAEIEAVCEASDFHRFNSYFMQKIYGDQPLSVEGVINRTEYRPLEGFILAVTPFNFTAIASNLPTAPALMGNVSLWKPATTALLSNYYLMQVYKEAGMPDGVINFIPGKGSVIGKTTLESEYFGGLHFTGSKATFDYLWQSVGNNLSKYNQYPRIVGETGGKDFIMAHPSANPREIATAMVRGAYEYQGQKCSAVSRAYVPKSLWDDTYKELKGMIDEIEMGDVQDFKKFMGAVIDEASFDNVAGYIDQAKKDKEAEVIIGGNYDKSKGWFIEPTVIRVSDPKYVTMEEELFAPVLTVYVYDDEKYMETLHLLDETSPYALTGSIFAKERYAITEAEYVLRQSAGNFYINDKPTGSIVGQQPFGGARRSGTNDKAGSLLNLTRWVSQRAIKENLNPPRDFKYAYMGDE